MKILYITSGKGIDYLNDMLFHGLISLGHEVLDSNYLWYLSEKDPDKLSKAWGKGFTIGGTLPDRSLLNRNPEYIQDLIISKYFDVIIYGSIWRCDDYLNLVLQYYPKNRIIYIDGEDAVDCNISYVNTGMYFKRELTYSVFDTCLPISFAIPEEKITNDPKIYKTKFLSSIIPGQPYTYNKEKEYYNEYKTSMFGWTQRKTGWDCMRHYEIIANKCLPYFKDFYLCPKPTMTTWPTLLQTESNQLYNLMISNGIDKYINQYDRISNEFFDYCKNNLTTKHLAQHILKYIE